jgi:hypothetical protein
MIVTATFVMLIAATAIADNAYPPCTNSARITAAHSDKHQGPRSISRALKENTARHTISRATRGSSEPGAVSPLMRMRWLAMLGWP